MTALYIVGGILLFLTAVMMIRAEAVISYADEFGLCLKIIGLKIRIFPKKPKKVRIRNYSVKRIEARRRKEARAAEKKAKKEAKKAQKKKAAKEKKEKPDIIRTLKIISSALSVAVKRFGKHLKIRIARLHIAVATGDAASTAILYGGIVQAVCYIASLLDASSTLRAPAKADVDVHADFLAESTKADVEIGFSLRLWQLLDVAFRAGFAALRKMNDTAPADPEPKKKGSS